MSTPGSENSADKYEVSDDTHPADEVAPAEASAAADPLELAETKAAEHWDKYLRAVAELDNVRKRSARDIENAHKYAVERFATDLLAVADSLAMGIGAAEQAGSEDLKVGTEATLKLLGQVFERFGIEKIDPLGEPFDPQVHEAMTMLPSASAEPGSVIEVVQLGYQLNGRLMRPARVIVAAAPS